MSDISANTGNRGGADTPPPYVLTDRIKSIEGTKLESPTSLKLSRSWTPERREAMRQRMLANIAKAKAEGVYQDRVNPDTPQRKKEEERWTPEKKKAIEEDKLQSPTQIRLSQLWTPEMKEAARERAMKRNAEAKDESERLARRRKTRYLRKVDTGELFVWNQHLAQRKDMVEVKEGEQG